jgi:hypothetical protein
MIASGIDRRDDAEVELCKVDVDYYLSLKSFLQVLLG